MTFLRFIHDYDIFLIWPHSDDPKDNRPDVRIAIYTTSCLNGEKLFGSRRIHLDIEGYKESIDSSVAAAVTASFNSSSSIDSIASPDLILCVLQ